MITYDSGGRVCQRSTCFVRWRFVWIPPSSSLLARSERTMLWPSDVYSRWVHFSDFIRMGLPHVDICLVPFSEPSCDQCSGSQDKISREVASWTTCLVSFYSYRADSKMHTHSLVLANTGCIGGGGFLPLTYRHEQHHPSAARLF